MRLRILLSALAALALLATPASAHPGHGRYILRYGHRCHKGYRKLHRRVKRHHRAKWLTICVKRHRKHPKATATAPAKVKLHAHLDPSYTRDDLDPFKVTYAYSASATQEFAAATASSEEAAPLPSGVLALYSDGQLECAINVGSGVEGSECPVHYKSLGEHRVTTIYSSGEQSATETEVENIGPLGTETTLNMSYEDNPDPQEVTGVNVQSGWYDVGTLHISAGAQPSGQQAMISCGEPPTETNGHVTAARCYVLPTPSTEEQVYATGDCQAPVTGIRIMQAPPSTIEPAGTWPSPEDIMHGLYHLRAATAGSSGYSSSAATAALEFSPAWGHPSC